MSSTSKDDQFFNGEWIRKATDLEEVMEKAHLAGHLLIWYQLDLSSKEPLQEEQVRTALYHMYRKTPSLNVCYGTRDGETWFKRATNPNVDFKVIDGSTLEDVRKSLRTYRRNSEAGPVFCARLLINSRDTDNGAVDLEPGLLHKSHMFFGLHHGVTDGTSNMYLMGFFVNLINEVIANNPIDDEVPLGTFVDSEETDRLVLEKRRLLECDPELLQKIENEAKALHYHTPLVIKCLPQPQKENITESIVRVLDPDLTSRFIDRCRQEKITVNGVLTAIFNMTVVDILLEHGVTEEDYTVVGTHCVNVRRYWDSDHFNPLGLHMGFPLALFTKTPKDVKNHFWEYAKNFVSDFKNDVVSGKILLDMAYGLLESEKGTDKTAPPQSSYWCDFITSGMCDVTSKVTEGGDHVRVTNLARGSTIHNIPYPTLINCHTFRGIMTISLDYGTAALETSVVERMLELIVKHIQELTG